MIEVIVYVVVIALSAIGIYCHNKIKHLIWLQHDYDKNTSKYEDCPKELYISIENSVKLISLVLGRLFSLILAIAIFVLEIL